MARAPFYGVLALLGLTAFAGEPSLDLEVRVLDAPARIVFSRGKDLLAAMQLRRAEDAPVLADGAEWRAAAAVPAGKEHSRLVEFKSADGMALVSIVVQVKRTAGGARVLVSPSLAAAGEMDLLKHAGPGAAPTDLEWAVELFPAAGTNAEQGKGWPELTGVDTSGTLADIANPARLTQEFGKPFRAQRLSFNAPDSPRIEIARSAPVRWTLAKSKRSRMLTHRLQPDPRRPQVPGAFMFYLGEARDGGAPDFGPLTLDRRKTPVWDYLEGSLRVYAGGADPYGYDELYVYAEIALPLDPAGPPDAAPAVARIPCFFFEGAADRPGEGEFRFRFAPPQEGAYAVRIRAVAPGGVSTGEAVAFQAGPPASHGFVRVRKGERYFRHDGGRVHVPVGLNLCWPPKQGDPAAYRAWFRELARHGGNAARVWLSSWGLPLEAPEAGRFDPQIAQALDEIFLEAQARDIGVILVADNAHDLRELSAQHPYFRERGGPLLATAEFFRDVQATKLFKRRLTYLAARYGAFRSLLAWELLNEADEAWTTLKYDPDDERLPPLDADTARAARRNVLTWANLLAEHLQAMDGQAHPVMLSVALPPGHRWPSLHESPFLSAVQEHAYVPYAADASSDRELDAAALVAHWARAAREPDRPHKPYFLGEFGYRALHDPEFAQAAEEVRNADRNLRDAEGLLLHNASFAALASGMAAVPMNWWWDRYVERHELWKRFRGPARFARALENLATRDGAETLRLLSLEAESAQGVRARVLGCAGRTGLCVWVQDRRSTWARLLEENLPAPPEIAGLDLRLPRLAPGHYTVRWLDTWSGEEREVRELRIALAGEAEEAPLSFACPAFRRDIALFVEPVAEE